MKYKNKKFLIKQKNKICKSWYSRDRKYDGLCENCGQLYKNHK